VTQIASLSTDGVSVSIHLERASRQQDLQAIIGVLGERSKGCLPELPDPSRKRKEEEEPREEENVEDVEEGEEEGVVGEGGDKAGPSEPQKKRTTAGGSRKGKPTQGQDTQPLVRQGAR